MTRYTCLVKKVLHVTLTLYKTTDTSIRRHPKIRGEANPFDPSWRAYLEDRAFFKKFGIHRHEAGLQTVK